jgi:hypothetical protein
MEIASSRLKMTLLSQGYAIIPGLFSASQLRRIRAATSRMIDRWYGGERNDADYWAFVLQGNPNPILYRIHNLEKKGKPEVQEILGSAPLQRAVGAVFGGPSELTQCALIVKIPRRGGEIPWHRDPIDVHGVQF